MPKSRIPSPARSQVAPVTPRRYKSRGPRSVGSPARSNASGRLTSVIEQFKENNMDSFALSPLSKTVLTDNTDIEQPRRKSWWKKVENSRDVIEILENDVDNMMDAKNVIEEFDVEILSQEKKNYSIDLPESSGSESISSIVIPQRKLFTQKDNLPQNKFGDVIGTRESLAKHNKTNMGLDKTANAGTKNLFNQGRKRTKPIFPSALLNVSPDKTITNKTKEATKEIKTQARSLFGNRPETKRKNMFTDFIVSESEEEIPEIQPKLFAFQRNLNPVRHSSRGIREPSPSSSITTDIEMDDWKLLPSSTMVDHQLEAVVATTTPAKKIRLSKLSEAKESKSGTINTSMDSKMQQSNKSLLKSKSKLSPQVNKETHNATSSKNRTNSSKTVEEQKSPINTKQNVSLRKSQAEGNNIQNNSNETLPKVTSNEKNCINTIKNQTQILNNSSNIHVLTVNKTSSHKDSKIEIELENEVQKNITTQRDIDNEEEHFTLTYDENEDPEEIDSVNVEASLKGNKSTNNEILQSDKSYENDKQTILISENRKSKSSQLNKSKPEDKKVIDNKEAELENKENVEHEENNGTEVPEEDTSAQNADYAVEKIEHKEQTHEEEMEADMEKAEYEKMTVETVENDDDIENNSDQEQGVGSDDEEQERDNVSDENEMDQEEEVVEANNAFEDNQGASDDDDQIEAQIDEENNSEEIIQSHNEVETESEDKYRNTKDTEALQNENQNEIQYESEEEIRNTKDTEALQYENQNEVQNESEGELEDVTSNEIIQDESHDEAQNANEVENEEVENEASFDERQNESEDEIQDDEAEDEDENNVLNESRVVETEGEDDDQEVPEEAEDVSENLDDVSEDIENENVELESEVEDSNERPNETESQDEEEDCEYDEEQVNGSQEEIQNTEEIDQEDQDNEAQNDEMILTQEAEPEESPNITHDTTGRNRNKKEDTKSPEAILHNITHQADSFVAEGRNTSIRKTKSILKNFTLRPSLAPPRDSTGFSDGTKNSSAEGSGWDSHRTTRKTLRQTFGRDFTPRKSLRALVMEKSAKRQTTINEANALLKLPQANSTELPEKMPLDDDDMNEEHDGLVEVSDHEISQRTKQTTLEAYLQKIKIENMERQRKIEAQVRESFKSNSQRIDLLNRAPLKPIKQRTINPVKSAPKRKRVKPTLISLEDLPADLQMDMKYKPPKRYQPRNASWITKRLYKFLETKLEPKYDYKARVRAEKLVETIYEFARSMRKVRVAPPHAVAELKHEMARLDIVKTHFEFYNFFNEYMPIEIKVKVVPDIVNNIPLPRDGIFADIAVK